MALRRWSIWTRRRIEFENVADRWSYVVAFVAANTATPMPDLLDLNLANFLVWHKQAARLASGRHRTSIRMMATAVETLAANPSIFTKEPA